MPPLTKAPSSISVFVGFAAVAAALFAGPCVHRAQAQLLQYSFNDTGTTTTNTGSSTGANLTFENSAATATDLHSAAGGGVSGQTSDLAFANSATGMGSAGTGGAAFNTTTTALNGLGTLTLTGWYNAASAPFGSGARLLISSSQALSLNFNSTSFALLLTTTNAGSAATATVSTTNAIANAAGSWVFFAATYDGTSLKLYLGNPTTSAASVSTVALAGTTNVGNGLYIGNVSALNRPFSGSVDDVRLYGSALTTAQIDAIQTADEANMAVPVPEPSSLLTLGVLALGGFAVHRRRPTMV